MPRKLDPATRRMVERSETCFVHIDKNGNEHVVDTSRRSGPQARQIAAAMGLGQLRQADQQRSKDQVFDTPEDEERIRRDQKARHDAEVAAHRKMFGIE